MPEPKPWTNPALEKVPFPELPVYVVEKVCTNPACGKIWMGNSFRNVPESEWPVPYTCDDCQDAAEREQRRRQGLHRPTPVAQRPVPPPTADTEY